MMMMIMMMLTLLKAMGISILAACQNDCSQNWTEAWSKPDEIQ
jgi:hypothetical protein